MDGPGQLARGHALLFSGHDVHGHDGDDGAIHRHGDGHLVQRNAVKEDFRVFDRVDRHPGHADVAVHARMVGVVAAVGGQVEGHAQTLLTGLDVGLVEFVTLLHGGKPGVLTDGPRSLRVHGWVGALGEGELSREFFLFVGRGQVLHILGRVDGLEGDPFGSREAERVGILPLHLLGGFLGPLLVQWQPGLLRAVLAVDVGAAGSVGDPAGSAGLAGLAGHMAAAGSGQQQHDAF